MTEPLLSVIVPVYRAEKYLKRCVESILCQTETDLELILVDDGSPDQSGALCDDFAQRDVRVRVIHKKNGGAASARNQGIEAARGRYIGFVDSDDMILPEMYRSMIGKMEQEQLLVLDSLCANVRGSERHIPQESGELVIRDAQTAIGSLLDWIGNCSLCTRLFRAEVFRDGFRISEGRRVEDFDFCIRLFDRIGSDALWEKCFYYVTENPDSVTKRGGGGIFLDALYYAEQTERLVRDSYPSLQSKLDFFRFYCVLQLFINARKHEYAEYAADFRAWQSYLRKNKRAMLHQPLLSARNRILLLLSCVDYRIPARLYRMKK